jgi:hypothetical protein
MFIQRDRFVIDFKPYKENFTEIRSQQIILAAEQQRLEQEEKKDVDVLNIEL